MADPAMEHHCLKGFPDIGELRTIWKKKYREYEYWYQFGCEFSKVIFNLKVSDEVNLQNKIVAEGQNILADADEGGISIGQILLIVFVLALLVGIYLQFCHLDLDSFCYKSSLQKNVILEPRQVYSRHLAQLWEKFFSMAYILG